MNNSHLLTVILAILCACVSAQGHENDYNTPYSAEVEEPMLSRKIPPSKTAPTQFRQDTTSAAVAWIAPFQGGYRTLRRDGKMGLLNKDLSVRVPFIYVDVQQVSTGMNKAVDFVLVGRRSSRGRYAVIGEDGVPTSEFVLSYNNRLRIFDNCIIDSPHPGQFFIRHRDGSPSSKIPFAAAWPHPLMLTNHLPLLTVRNAGNWRLALFNVDKNEVVTEFKYNRLSPVEPVIRPRNFVPIMEGYTRYGIELLRPDGRKISNVLFEGIEDYNNWKELREYFDLPDDTRAEAIAWTRDMDIYVIYDNDLVRKMGRFEML